MPHDDFDRYLAGFVPLPPDPLPAPAPSKRWLVPLVLAAALALVVWRLPRPAPPASAREVTFTLGRANAVVVAGTPWKTALDEAAFSGRQVNRGSLEFLTQEELSR